MVSLVFWSLGFELGMRLAASGSGNGSSAGSHVTHATYMSGIAGCYICTVSPGFWDRGSSLDSYALLHKSKISH